MKRSNRLVLLIGIFLAVVAFVLILITLQGGSNQPTTPVAPTTTKVVIAVKAIPLGAKIAPDAVATKDVTIPAPADSYADTSFVVGQTARQAVEPQQLITSKILSGGGSISTIEVPAGFVGVALQVDQITGVGTLIKAGDYVDVVTGISGKEKVPLVQWQPLPSPGAYAPEPLPYNPTTVKTIVQGLQVLGVLLPPPPTAGATAAPGAQTDTGTTLNGQQEIVIVAATTQQAEAIKFSQMDGDMISLALRAAADCRNADGSPAPCASATTTGITLRVLVDIYGVLPPQVVQVLQPPARTK